MPIRRDSIKKLENVEKCFGGVASHRIPDPKFFLSQPSLQVYIYIMYYEPA